MKNVFLFALLLFCGHAFCQSDNAVSSKDDKVFTVVEQMPRYPGNDEALKKFIETNMQYPKLEMDSSIQGRVVIRFIVNTDGSISDIEILRGISKGLDAEAIRLAKMFPKFIPGKQQGKTVRVSYVLPIAFRLSSSTPAKR